MVLAENFLTEAVEPELRLRLAGRSAAPERRAPADVLARAVPLKWVVTEALRAGAALTRTLTEGEALLVLRLGPGLDIPRAIKPFMVRPCSAVVQTL